MGRTHTKQSGRWGFIVPVHMWASCCVGNTGCPGSSSAFLQVNSQELGRVLRQFGRHWGRLMQFFLYSPLCSSAVIQQRPIYQNWEKHAAFIGSLNKIPFAAQWCLNFCCIVIAGIILPFYICILALPTPFSFEKIH